jgi:hypothetical protein
MISVRRWRSFVAATALGFLGLSSGVSVAQTAPTYTSGHISNITFAGDEVLIMVDAGLPGNCTGASWGWMRIPPANSAMNAFVIGLWMRGDAASVVVTVYSDGLAGGYCRITQIDPAG